MRTLPGAGTWTASGCGCGSVPAGGCGVSAPPRETVSAGSPVDAGGTSPGAPSEGGGAVRSDIGRFLGILAWKSLHYGAGAARCNNQFSPMRERAHDADLVRLTMIERRPDCRPRQRPELASGQP